MTPQAQGQQEELAQRWQDVATAMWRRAVDQRRDNAGARDAALAQVAAQTAANVLAGHHAPAPEDLIY